MAQYITFKQLRKLIKGKQVYAKCGCIFILVKPVALRGLAVTNDLNELRFQVTVDAAVLIHEIARYTPPFNAAKFDTYDPSKYIIS